MEQRSPERLTFFFFFHISTRFVFLNLKHYLQLIYVTISYASISFKAVGSLRQTRGYRKALGITEWSGNM